MTTHTAKPAGNKGPVLVTGGTGFLGEHLLRALREGDGAVPVRVLCREPTDVLHELGVSVYQGDLIAGMHRAPSEPDPYTLHGLSHAQRHQALREATEAADAAEQASEELDTLLGALDGCKRVYHLAGLVSRDPAKAQRMMQLHVDGTRRLLHACKRAGVERVVLLSTSGTIAISKDPEPIPDETWPYPVDLCGSWPYYLSKIYQEKLALRLAAKLGIELVVVNPSLLLGPGDRRGSSTGDVRQFIVGEMSAVPSGGLSFVDARDAAAATVAAMERGRDGQRYLLGGPNWTFKEFIGRLSRIAKVDAPLLRIPSSWNKVLGKAVAALDHAYRHRGHSAPVDRISFEMSQYFWYCDSSLAQRELGFTARDPAETLDDTVRDIRAGLRY